MKTAFPINAKGEREGATRTFTDTHWAKMVNTNGSKLRWKLYTPAEKEPIKQELIPNKPEVKKELIKPKKIKKKHE